MVSGKARGKNTKKSMLNKQDGKAIEPAEAAQSALESTSGPNLNSSGGVPEPRSTEEDMPRYKCPETQCGKRFGRSWGLQRHMMAVHMDLDFGKNSGKVKFYDCTLCSFRTTRMDTAARHFKSKTHIIAEMTGVLPQNMPGRRPRRRPPTSKPET